LPLIERCAVGQRLSKSWSLLALCGILDALFAALILFVLSPDGAAILRAFVPGRSAIQPLGLLALAAGACTIAAGIWNSKQVASWFLALNGLACSALGTIVILGATRPVKFRTLALLIVVMAASIAVYELVSARKLRQHPVEEWLMAGAGVVSIGFAGVFLGFVLGWISLEPSPSAQTFHWLGSYFAFSATCMLGMALGYLRPSGSIRRNPLQTA
jgi:uncharacterized membrane protein HdeD (DUF308 family)